MFMLRRLPDRFRQPWRPLRGRHNGRMIHTRDAGASALRNLGTRSDWRQLERHVLCDYCAGTWRLYSAGRPCLNLKFVIGASGAGYRCWGGHIRERHWLTTP